MACLEDIYVGGELHPDHELVLGLLYLAQRGSEFEEFLCLRGLEDMDLHYFWVSLLED